MGQSTDPGGGPKIMMLALSFGAGAVLGFLACHFNLCVRLGICQAPVAVEAHPGPVDPGPR